MKNPITTCCAVSLLIFVGLACKNNPLARFTNQYSCTIEGEPQPKTADEYFRRAAKHIEDANYSSTFNKCAFDAISEGLELDPQNAFGYAKRAILLRSRAKEFVENKDTSSAKRDFEASLDDANQSITLDPANPSFYESRSYTYEKSNFLDPGSELTLRDISKAIELEPGKKSLVSLYQRRGDIYIFKKEYKKAVSDLSGAIELKPEDGELYSKRARAYFALGEEDLAMKDDMKVFQLKVSPIKDTAGQTSTKSDTTKTIAGGILNGKAVRLPEPQYPPAAKAVNARGAVNVQIVIDEQGNVITASAVSGHPLLRAAAESAARSARFNPTKLSDTPVKVSGIIVFNFAGE